mgnify:FL=1
MTDKRCGTCKHWTRTRKHGGQGGSRLACKPQQDEYWKQFEGKRYVWDITTGYGARHKCHRPDDYEAKEES